MTPQEKLAARIHQATRLTWDHCAALTKLSNARFEAFAGVDASDETALAKLDPVDAMQARLARWQSRNFGVPSSTQLVCGIVEELAELDEAELDQDHDAMVDAIGDTAIYCAQLCTMHRLSMAVLVDHAARAIALRAKLAPALGLLSHVAVKSEQRIRGLGNRDLARVGVAAGLISLFALLIRFDTVNSFLSVSSEVLRRDWIANPDGPVQA